MKGAVESLALAITLWMVGYGAALLQDVHPA